MRGRCMVLQGSVILGLLLVTGAAAQAAPEGATLDVRTLRCAAFIDMASKEAGRFRVLVGWLDGWLNGEKAAVSYSLEVQAEQGRRWLERCRADPSKPLLDLVRSAG